MNERAQELSELPAEYPPGLRDLLAQELALGNTVRSITRGFPSSNSVCVQLRRRLRQRDGVLPPGISHVRIDDPHWWMDEYREGAAPHLLVG